MKISRTGASANHGTRSIELKRIKFRLNARTQSLEVSSPSATSDFSTDARHKYNVSMDFQEIAQMLQVLGDDSGGTFSGDFADAMAESVPSMVRLLMTSCEVK